MQPTYFQLAKTLQNPSEFDQAYRNYETALEIDPSLTECHYQFANLLMKGEKLKNDGTHVLEPDLDRAEIHLRKAIAIDKEFYKATISSEIFYAWKKNSMKLTAYMSNV